MSDETVKAPWEEHGFKDFDEVKSKMDSLQKQFDDTKSKVGSQGDELGTVKAERDGLAQQLADVAPFIKQMTENPDLFKKAATPATPAPATPATPPPAEKDWGDEKMKLRAKLTPEQAKTVQDSYVNMTDEQKKLVDTDEGQVLFLKEHVLSGQSSTGIEGDKNPFSFLTTEPKTDLAGDIKSMFVDGRKAAVNQLPVGSSAQAGNATALGGVTQTAGGSNVPEGQTFTPDGLLGQMHKALQ